MAAKLIEIGASGRQRIDRYELIAEIAAGGMATVFLARLTGVGGFQRFVAVKRLHPHLASEKEFVEMFLDEARLAAGIHHPNVVPIMEVGAGEQGYYLVMEYIEGDTLARLLARGASKAKRLPVDVVLRIGIDMLQGLHAAHELKDENGEPTNLVHRDVSPQNVLVGVDGIARITDFGVAHAASRLTATRAGQLKGKIAYMAPEQASGAEDLDRRADVFSAGIVIWEALAARRLFKAENEAATLSRVMADPIPELSGSLEVDPAINAVVMKALQRDLSKRFSTCLEFAEALEEAAGVENAPATFKELAHFVGEMLGTEIAQQRDAVRAWLAKSEPSQTDLPKLPPGGTSSSVSASSLTVPGSESGMLTSPTLTGTQRPASRVPLYLLLSGIFIAAVAILFYVRQPTARVELPATKPPTAVASPVPSSTTPTPPLSGDAGADAGKLPVVSPESLGASPTATSAVRQSPRPAAPKGTYSKKKSKKSGVDLTNPYR